MLEKLEFFACADFFLSETARFADVVLPGSQHEEDEGTVCSTEGRVIKVVACLKKRLGAFQPELRELQIGPRGITVGGKLEMLRGVLTGVPDLRGRVEPPA